MSEIKPKDVRQPFEALLIVFVIVNIFAGFSWWWIVPIILIPPFITLLLIACGKMKVSK